MGKGATWTNAEKVPLLTWVKNHPSGPVGGYAIQVLGKFIPTRTEKQIRAMITWERKSLPGYDGHARDGYIGKFKLWTTEETNILSGFIFSHLNVSILRNHPIPSLMTILPGRTWRAIQKKSQEFIKGGRKMGRGITWTDEERATLKDWIDRYPTVHFGKRSIPPGLSAMLPNRTPSQIAAMHWYYRSLEFSSQVKNFDLKPFKQNPEPKQVEPSKPLTSYLDSIISEFIRSEVDRLSKQNDGRTEDLIAEVDLLSEENTKIKSELATCKEILRKLTPIREACEKFHL